MRLISFLGILVMTGNVISFQKANSPFVLILINFNCEHVHTEEISG